jgi:hypothetical protein
MMVLKKGTKKRPSKRKKSPAAEVASLKKEEESQSYQDVSRIGKERFSS